jgi:urease accessory protein
MTWATAAGTITTITTIIMITITTRTTDIATTTKPVPDGTEGISGADLLTLTAWLSPAFPIGGFAHSHGLEWAVESGDLSGADAVRDWMSDLLRCGSGRDDAILLSAAHRATAAGDDAALREIAETAVAMQPSAERLAETASLGNAFVKTVRAAWPTPALDRLPAGDVAYPVAVGVAAAGRGLPRLPVVEAFLAAFVSSLLSAAIRLGPIGQTDGQRILAALIPAILRTAAFAARAGLDDLGGCAFRSDIASMRHETQYTRLFRS